jgi:hypothetical protein
VTSQNGCGHCHAWSGGAEDLGFEYDQGIVEIELGSKVPLAVVCASAYKYGPKYRFFHFPPRSERGSTFPPQIL